jgi:hypothetical protein
MLLVFIGTVTYQEEDNLMLKFVYELLKLEKDDLGLNPAEYCLISSLCDMIIIILQMILFLVLL